MNPKLYALLWADDSWRLWTSHWPIDRWHLQKCYFPRAMKPMLQHAPDRFRGVLRWHWFSFGLSRRKLSLQRPELLHQFNEYGVFMVIMGCCISNLDMVSFTTNHSHRVLAVVTQGGITWCYFDSMWLYKVYRQVVFGYTSTHLPLQVASDQQSSDSSARVERAVAQARAKIRCSSFHPLNFHHFHAKSITLHHIRTVFCKWRIWQDSPSSSTSEAVSQAINGWNANHFQFQFLA